MDPIKKEIVKPHSDKNVTATSKAPHASFTLGKHIWTFTGDESRSPGIEYERELKMSGCQKGNFKKSLSTRLLALGIVTFVNT